MCAVYDRGKSKVLEDRLSNFLKTHFLTLSNDTDIISVCNKLGLQAVYMPLNDGVDGLILVDGKHRIIAIKSTLEPIDTRFLIAHELAHYITAYDSADKKGAPQFCVAAKDTLRHGSDKPQLEHDMDYLAAAILVPFEQFKKELDSKKINYKNLRTESDVTNKFPIGVIKDFAKRYRVTQQLIVRRIAEISYYA